MYVRRRKAGDTMATTESQIPRGGRTTMRNESYNMLCTYMDAGTTFFYGHGSLSAQLLFVRKSESGGINMFCTEPNSTFFSNVYGKIMEARRCQLKTQF